MKIDAAAGTPAVTVSNQSDWWTESWSRSAQVNNETLKICCISGKAYWRNAQQTTQYEFENFICVFFTRGQSTDLNNSSQVNPLTQSPFHHLSASEIEKMQKIFYHGVPFNMNRALIWQGPTVPSESELYEVLWAGEDCENQKEPFGSMPSHLKNGQHFFLGDFKFSSRSPLFLESVSVPKPWGREVWYTGVEKRGVCAVRAEAGSFPLPYYELLRGRALKNAASSVVLLKELEPFEEEFYGELYTELHELKAEIYVVSGISKSTTGAVKIGVKDEFMNPMGLELLQSDLLKYEEIRRKIDHSLEESGHEFSSPAHRDDLLSFKMKKAVLVSAEDLACEKRLFEKARSYFNVYEIGLGDVVRVPTFVPHALQPGVTVVEFQTPHYERKIMSSNQKVLTQETWDVAEAVALIANQNLQKSPETAKHLGERAIERVLPPKDTKSESATESASGPESRGLAQGAQAHVIVDFKDLFACRLSFSLKSSTENDFEGDPCTDETSRPKALGYFLGLKDFEHTVVGFVLEGVCEMTISAENSGVRSQELKAASDADDVPDSKRHVLRQGMAFLLPQAGVLIASRSERNCQVLLGSNASFLDVIICR